jgi:hypothetical protein
MVRISAESTQARVITRLEPNARRRVLALTWGISLLTVGLPQAVVDLLGGTVPTWLPVLGVALVLSMLLASFMWTPLRPFRRYWVVLLVMQPAIHPGLWPAGVVAWEIPVVGAPPAIGAEMVRELALALVMIAALLATGHRRDRSYLTAGRLGAPAAPVRWLIDRPISWARLGPLSGVLIALGTLAFVLIGGEGPDIARVGSVLPTVLVLAGLNAFNEEVTFRAGPLASLGDVVGDRQVVFLVATLFAVPHYFGVPYGLVGVGMAWVFAWWVTKSMVETRGIAWAWFIHLLQDVVIFTFLLAGSVA